MFGILCFLTEWSLLDIAVPFGNQYREDDAGENTEAPRFDRKNWKNAPSRFSLLLLMNSIIILDIFLPIKAVWYSE